MPFGVARMNLRPAMKTVGENARTAPWVAAVVTAGGTVSAGRRTLVNDLYNRLDAAGLTPARLWLHAAENAPSALVDLYGLASATAVNSPTFTANQGYAGNGTSSYLNLGTSSAGTQNSSAFGVYMRTDIGGLGVVDIGSSSNTVPYTSTLNIEWSDGTMYAAINDANADGGRSPPATNSGIWMVSRTVSTEFVIYHAGSSFGTGTPDSSGVPNLNYTTGASFDSGGVATLFSTRQYGMSVLAGTGWTGTQVANFTTHIQTYLTAVGA